MFQDELEKHLQARNTEVWGKKSYSKKKEKKKGVLQWKLKNSLQTQRPTESSLQGRKTKPKNNPE